MPIRHGRLTGTTEEFDKLVVAAALHKVYGDDWHKKMCELIIARDGKDGIAALKNQHYIHEVTATDGTKQIKYVPEVDGAAKFAMIDGGTLAESVLLLLHQDSRKKNADGKAVGPVHNLYEYTVRMSDAGSILKELNPDFPLEFADKGRDLPKAGIIENPHLMECTDPGKIKRAEIWAHGMDTSSSESTIGKFKRYDPANDKEAMRNGQETAIRRSIRENYDRAVAFFQKMKLAESAVAVATKPDGTDRTIA